jgi:DNA mismatch repair protein MutL
MAEKKHIQALPSLVARKIAAGEVIDRPASVVRELMENAVDSGATRIEVSISQGGVEEIRVRDNGSGIFKDDLEVICTPHATSKIQSEEDLFAISTLGFRGEALSSINAVADIEIITSTDGALAWAYRSGPGQKASVSGVAGTQGTSVRVSRLFESFPARKAFLKRASAETLACQQTFIDRALPRPDIDFRLNLDGKPKLILPPSSLKARVLAAYSGDEPESFFHEVGASLPFGGFRLVLGQAEITRPDRRHLHCFVNGRRVQDFSLMKWVEVGLQGLFPGGCYPYAFLFLTVDPARVDFNIHPAKKELRFREAGQIQGDLIHGIRKETDFLHRRSPEGPLYSAQEFLGLERPGAEESPRLPSFGGFGLGASSPARAFADRAWQAPASHYANASTNALDNAFAHVSANAAVDLAALALSRKPLAEAVSEAASEQVSASEFRLLGQCLGTFVVFELGDKVYFLDQHAAHERILYDGLLAKQVPVQELLIPYSFEPEHSGDVEFLRNNGESLNDSGYRFEEEGGGSWALVTHPAGYSVNAKEIVSELLGSRDSGAALRSRVAAMTACKAAIKDGERLEASTMADLVARALRLPEPRCPHGRPIWFCLSRADLFGAVKRVVD